MAVTFTQELQVPQVCYNQRVKISLAEPPPASATGFDEIRARLRSAYGSLSASEQRVADRLASEPELLQQPLRQIAARADVSDATVVRFCQALGYDGLRGLKRQLAASALAPVRLLNPAVGPDDDIAVLADKVIESDRRALADTFAILDYAALAMTVDCLIRAPRIECYAVGSSVPVALDLYYRLLRLGLATAIVTDPHMQATSAAQLPTGAVAFAISHLGRSTETEAALRWAKQAGATCVLLTSRYGTPIGRLADVELVCAAPESALRPEAVAARIAHLAVVDVLSVAVALRRPGASSEALRRDDAIIAEREIQ
jgi:DNA-binding MurR/RpiR family transcriptional regulator